MENEFQNENNVIKKSVIGSVSYFEELGRMDSLKIRIDLIKDLTLKNLIPARRHRIKRELSKKEYNILFKIRDSIVMNLFSSEDFMFESSEAILKLETILNEIILKDGELYFIPKTEEEGGFNGKNLIEILEEEREEEIFVNENEVFLKEYDFGEEWLNNQREDGLYSLRRTNLEDNNLIPLPDIVRDAFLNFLSKYRGLFHKPFVSMNTLKDIFINYKELYTKNEINSILNMLSIEDDLGRYRFEVPYSIFYTTFYIYDSREKTIIDEYGRIFGRDFMINYFEKTNEIKKLYDVDEVDGKEDFPALDRCDNCLIINRKKLKKGPEYNILGWKIPNFEKEFMKFTVQLRDKIDGNLCMGNKTFKLLNDDFIKKGRELLYRIEYLKDVSYTINGVTYKVEKGMLGGYVSKKSFICEDVIILKGAEVMSFVFLSTGVVVDNGVTLKRYSRVYKYNFKVDKNNVDSFNGRKFNLRKELVEVLEN